LYRFLRHHPEILVVFHNVEKDHALEEGVILASGDSKDIVKVYIDHLHIPLLLEHNIIGRSSSRRCGFEPLVSGLEYKGYDSVYSAQVAADRATAISRTARATDDKNNSLYCYYHGAGESIKASQGLLTRLRQVVLEYASSPGELESEETSMTFDLVISARLGKGS
jgi:hypothetical protein